VAADEEFFCEVHAGQSGFTDVDEVIEGPFRFDEADVIDLIFADDTGRCDFCGIPFSLLCRRCHSGKVRCEGHCNKVCCFRCFNKINRCVFDCEFTCVTYCTTTIFCYALGGHICGKCIHIHEEVCGCVAYNHIDSCINSNYDDGEDPRRLKSL
jgi:hypothetical protein